jgi:U3 small nucleolar RNA-associated protein 10
MDEDPAPASDPAPVLAGCLSVMRQALQHLQALHPTGDDEEDDSEDERSGDEIMRSDQMISGRRRAVNAATDGLYDMTAALRSLLVPADYLKALLTLADHPAEPVRRRALALYAACIASLAKEEGAAAWWEEGLPAPAAREARRRLARAAMALGGKLPALLAPGGGNGALTRQTALVAADAAVARFGTARAGATLAALPTVIAVAAAEDGGDAGADGNGANAPLRASALAVVAAAAAALGPKLVPLLPAAAAAALSAADAALAALAALGGPATRVGPNPAAAAANGKEPSDSGSDDGEEEEAAKQLIEAKEAQGLLLAASLAALEALVSHLGAFASPYLPRLIALVVSPAVLTCGDGDAAGRAARLRAALPAKVPPRLLVEPVVAAWDGALAACGADDESSSSDTDAYVEAGAAAAAPAVAHLELVAAVAAAMDHKSAAAHADALFALLLRALDTRQRQLAALADGDSSGGLGALQGGGAAAVEAAACAAAVALVMKLSEARFKPLFLRIVDWAASASAAAGGGAAASADAAASPAKAAAASGLGRVAALLAAACALSKQLRGVFVPYYKFLLDVIVSQLLSPLPGEGGERPKKKRRKGSETAATADADAAAAAALAGGDPASAAAALAGWLCRVRAMRALHLLSAHCGPDPMDHDRFTRLLAPLARQLSAAAPADAAPPRLAATLLAQTADADIDGPPTALALLGPAGLAAANAATGARESDNSAAAAAAPPPPAAADAPAVAAAGALVALALAGAGDAAWKPLTHAVLGAARAAAATAAGARTKLLALGVVSRLVAALREEWLVLVPEVLPYLAELVEDGEAAVEAGAQGLLAQLEEVSGEKLDSYLRA